ncbi:MAG TPA: VWA domain-containing protein [Vicinamibacterales bacterium]|nr:VWA domain-containing protein [Vicinamibacterales bacterium]
MVASRGRLFRVCAPFVGAALCLATLLAAPQDPQRQPPFRTATNLVRVDAYPSRDGRIIEGLRLEDFELLEDGVPQKIESFEYVAYPQSNPVDERRDPNSQREGFQLAADPTYRVFVIYLDNLHVHFTGSHNIRSPLITFLNRVLGSKDLFAVLTTRQGVKDLIFAQKTDFIEEQLTQHWDWGRGARVLDDEEDQILEVCGLSALLPRRRLHAVFSDLEALTTKLGEIREERKNLLLISNGWVLPAAPSLAQSTGRGMKPTPGITNAGKITLGSSVPGAVSPKMCEDMRAELAHIDFQRRLRDLLQLARESNVTFYSLRPTGLVAPVTPALIDHDRTQVDSLRVLSDNTDGLAIVNTNDLTRGAMRIADDLSGMYLLGYYPTNSKPDGRVRRITVRLRGSGEVVRARREYRAPSAEEVAAMRAARDAAAAAAAEAPSPVVAALAELKRLRPGAALHTRGAVVGDQLVLTTELAAAEIEAGRWKDGGELQVVLSGTNGDLITTARARLEPGQRSATIRLPLEKAAGPFAAVVRLRNQAQGTAEDGITVTRATGLFGDPLVFRLATPTVPRPAGSIHFRRTERIQVRWPADPALERPAARVLGRDGVPLELAPTVAVRHEDGAPFVVVDLNLAPLTAGEYLLEVSGAKGDTSGSALLAFRVSR